MRTDVSTTRAETIFGVKCQSFEASVADNRPSQDSSLSNDHDFQSRYVTLGFKPFPQQREKYSLTVKPQLIVLFSLFFCFLGVLNIRMDDPASTGPQTSDNRDELNAKEENLDSRFPEADFNAVDPAIMEKLAVYIARYSYDPVQHSPNENPEIELAFQAGDYLYVFGDMDEVRW